MHAQKLVGANFCTTSGLLTAAGAETVYDTTVTINYVLNGKIDTRTGVTDGVTPTTDYVSGATFPVLVGGNSVAGANGQGCIMLWGLIAGDNVRCIMGPREALDSSGNFVVAPQFPNFPDAFVPFAYQVLKAGATAAVNVAFGTTNWNATGYTNVIVNIATMPDRPQVS